MTDEHCTRADASSNKRVLVLKNDFSIGNSLWFIISAFMHQGAPVSPK